MTFGVDLKNLKRLHRDSEKQLLEFNEIVPYEHNPANVYSPKLVNLLLSVGPQIENVTDLIIIQLQLSPEGKGLSSRIKELDKDGVLSSFEITSMPQNTQFHPFTEDFSWWEIYNKTKHDLSRSQFEITYLSVMNSLAVLASLHRLANVVRHCNDDDKPLVLEKKCWQKTFDFQSNNPETSRRIASISSKSWKSLLFKIENYFVYTHDA